MSTLRNELYAAAIINLLLFLWFVWWCAQLLKRKCPACGYRNRNASREAPLMIYDQSSKAIEASKAEHQKHHANSRYCKNCRYDLTT